MLTAAAHDDVAIKNFIYSKVRDICESGCIKLDGRPVASIEMVAAALHEAGFTDSYNDLDSNIISLALLNSLADDGWLDAWHPVALSQAVFFTAVPLLDKMVREIG